MNLQEMFDLSGKTALVTGSSRGIGRAFARGLAQAGAAIVGVRSDSSPEQTETRRMVEETGQPFHDFACDLSDRKALHQFIQSVLAEHQIDILINNAGTIRRAPAAEHSDEFWDEVIRVNQDAPFILARDFGKHMVERGNGKIVFTASLLTFQGGITVPGYAASKGAVGQLTKAFANEWASKGVCVNAIAPGYIATDNTQALRENPARNQAIFERIPAGRWGTPDDLAGAVVFLSSPASDYVNGTILTVDGGWMGR